MMENVSQPAIVTAARLTHCACAGRSELSKSSVLGADTSEGLR